MAAVIAAPLVGLGLSSTAATTIATLGLYAATTAASIFLQMAMAEKPEEEIGTKLNAVLGGAVNQSFHIGDKESAGSFLYKGSWGKSGRVPNAYLVKVYCLSDRPVNGFADYLWVDGIKCNYDPEETTTIDGVGVGHPIPKYDQGGGHRLWVKFHDGNQSNADNYLVAKFGTGPRAWTEDFVGRGRAYMIVTQKYDKKNPSGEVEVLPVIKNSRLYDFRNDSTNGGSGAQRYNDDSTWGVDPGNPVTASYHIMRGLYRGNEWIFGGQKWPATRFDIATWTAAANKCDSDIAAGGGGTLKFSRVGAEIDVSEEPWTIIERMLKSCNGRLVESGGKFKIYAGGIGASVYSFTDDQVILSEELTGRVFPTRDDIANTVVGTYIEPANAGEAKAYKARTKTAYVEADGDVRKMTFDLDYVRDNRQAQRLAQLALNDNRRFRTFVVAFWSQARMLEPCDVISWTSDRFQFTNKKFIVGDVVLRDDGVVVANLREADATDADWNPITDENPFETGVFEDLADPTQTFAATVTAVPFTDEDGKNRRPAIRIQASLDDDFVDCQALRYQVRKRFGDQKVIHRGRSAGFFEVGNSNYGDIEFTSSAFVPMRGKQVQVRYKIDPESDRPTEWSDWADHTITLADLGVDDDDTSDDSLSAPTGLTVTAIQDTDEDGQTRTFIKMNCSAPAWATTKTTYVYEVTVGSDSFTVKSDDTKARYRVQKTGVLHSVRVRAVKGIGNKGDWTSAVTITPSRKTAAPSTVVWASNPIVAKPKFVRLRIEEPTDKDYKKTVYYRNTVNNSATATEIGRLAGTKFDDTEDLTYGTTYYYWAKHLDRSGNLSSSFSSVQSVVFRGVDDDDTSDDLLSAPTGLSVNKVQEKDEDGTIRTFLELDSTPAVWAGPKADFIYEITVAGRPKPYRIKSGDSAARFRVNKTGVLHTVRARMKSGVGRLSNWTSSIGITPSKKGADASAITSISINRKNGFNIVKWDAPAESDNRWVAIYRGTTNVFASMTEIGRTAGTKWRDDENLTKGVRYYYRVVPVDTSGNVGTAVASLPVDDVETGIGTSDTDATALAAPTGISIFQANRDVDQDGKVDIAMRTTFSGGVAGAAGYEVQWEDNAGQSGAVRADSGSFWFPANTQRQYRIKWRTINWVGKPERSEIPVSGPGAWSAYSSWVTPSPTSGAPSAPSGGSAVGTTFGFRVAWNVPTENDYLYTEVAARSSPGTPTSGEIGYTTSSSESNYFLASGGAVTYYIYARHVNTSGLKSGWTLLGSTTTLQIETNHVQDNAITRAKLAAGAAGNAVVTNSGTTMGAVNPGSGWTRTLLIMSFKATSNTSGVTVTLGGYSSTFDFVSGQYYCMTTVENGGGSFNAGKSGGNIANCQICAVGIY